MDKRRSTARTRHTGIRVAALLITLLISVPGFGAAHVAGASFMVSHPVPWSPLNLTLEDDGVIWMTFPAEDLVGRLTVNPNGDDFTAFTPPTANSEPYDLVYHDGTVWFTLKAGNRLARLDTNDLESGISEFVLPTAASEPTGLAIGRDGRVWVLAQGANKLVVFDPDTSTFDEVDMPASVHDAGAEKITTRGDNTVWFAAPDVNFVVSYDVNNDSFALASTISPTGVFTEPLGITMDAGGRPWVAVRGSDAVGRYTPETLSFWRWFKTPHDGGGATNLSIYNAGTRRRVFFSEVESGSVGYILIRSSDTRLLGVGGSSLPAANGRPWDIEADSMGHAWITDTAANAIVEWQPPYVNNAFLPRVHR